MDALDIRILRAMGPLPYAEPGGADTLRPARIARVVGVTPETARDRIARMEASGVIAGYDIVPNLRHLGLAATAYLVRARDEAHRDGLKRAIQNIEGVLEVTWFLGADACIDVSFATQGQLERRLRAIAEAAGDASPVPFMGWAMPPVERALTPLDWRILRALRGRAKRSLVEVADELGVGYRTVKRHHDRMLEEGDAFLRPLIDPAAEPGLVPTSLLFHFAPGASPDTTRRVLAAFDDHLVFARPPLGDAAGNLDVVLFADSPARAESLRERAARLDGVQRVQALVVAGVDERAGWLDELIDARLAGPGVADPAS